MKFCYASNAAIKNVKIEKKNSFYPKIFLTKSPFFPKGTEFLEKLEKLFTTSC